MSAADARVLERETLLQSVELYDEMRATVGERTLQIVEHRRRTAVVHRRGWLVRRVLLLADALGLTAAFLIAEQVTTARLGHPSFGSSGDMLGFALALPLWVIAAKLHGLYARDEERADHSTADEFVGVFHVVSAGAWLFAGAAYVTKLAHPTFGKLLLFWLAALVLVPASRGVARAVARSRVTYLQNTVILGAGDLGFAIARKILDHPEYRLNLVGIIGTPRGETKLEHVAMLGGAERLPAIIRLFDVERVIIAFSNYSDKQTAAIVKELGEFDVQVDVVPRLYELFAANAGLHMLEGLPLITMPPARLSWSSMILKRVIDALLAAFGIVFLAPVLVAIALVIKLDSRGPILYRHERVGRGGRRIEVLKFRTMRIEHCRGARYGGDAAEREFERLMSDGSNAARFAKLYKLDDDPRVTRVGKWLRKLSLDELPQLLNVVGGSLSLVGPRPITQDELPRYGADADALLSVRPGVTGYWQINGRSRLAYEDRVRLDISYIRGWSLGLDFQILANTLRVLVSRSGAV